MFTSIYLLDAGRCIKYYRLMANHVQQVLQRVLFQNVVHHICSNLTHVLRYSILILLEQIWYHLGDGSAYDLGQIFVVVQSGDNAL